jgi:hypothetical protein
MPRIRHLIALAALCAGAARAETDEPGLYLFRTPVTFRQAAALPLGRHIGLDLEVPNPGYLIERLGATSTIVRSVDGSVVGVEFESPSALRGEPQPRHSAASFVVDFDESSITELLSSLKESYGPAISVDELVAFADKAIPSKTYRRSFDIASRVARTGEGDCTEHAVLLAALARATGKPSRVVIGVLLIETENEVSAFGHAWTEIYDATGWRLADATRPASQLPGSRPHYLALMELEDEGPGYALSVINYAAIQPSRIGVLANTESSQTR